MLIKKNLQIFALTLSLAQISISSQERIPHTNEWSDSDDEQTEQRQYQIKIDQAVANGDFTKLNEIKAELEAKIANFTVGTNTNTISFLDLIRYLNRRMANLERQDQRERENYNQLPTNTRRRVYALPADTTRQQQPHTRPTPWNNFDSEDDNVGAANPNNGPIPPLRLP